MKKLVFTPVLIIVGLLLIIGICSYIGSYLNESFRRGFELGAFLAWILTPVLIIVIEQFIVTRPRIRERFTLIWIAEGLFLTLLFGGFIWLMSGIQC